MSFVPSRYSRGYGDDAASTSSSTLLSKVSGLVTGSGGGTTGLDAWVAVVNALSDPRERVAVLKAKIANYKAMKAKYGIGPLGDLYANQIRLMKARLQAEQTNLGLEAQGEASTSEWRTIGHGLGIVGIGVGVLVGAYVLTRTVKAAQA